MQSTKSASSRCCRLLHCLNKHPGKKLCIHEGCILFAVICGQKECSFRSLHAKCAQFYDSTLIYYDQAKEEKEKRLETNQEQEGQNLPQSGLPIHQMLIENITSKEVISYLKKQYNYDKNLHSIVQMRQEKRQLYNQVYPTVSSFTTNIPPSFGCSFNSKKIFEKVDHSRNQEYLIVSIFQNPKIKFKINRLISKVNIGFFSSNLIKVFNDTDIPKMFVIHDKYHSQQELMVRANQQDVITISLFADRIQLTNQTRGQTVMYNGNTSFIKSLGFSLNTAGDQIKFQSN